MFANSLGATPYSYADTFQLYMDRCQDNVRNSGISYFRNPCEQSDIEAEMDRDGFGIRSLTQAPVNPMHIEANTNPLPAIVMAAGAALFMLRG